MGSLFVMAIVPIIICCIYIFIRDKYEKEPIKLLILGLIYGALTTVMTLKTDVIANIFAPQDSIILEILYNSFVSAAFVEELYKYIILYFLVWKNHNFNERFDGIVYSVFISLGFAMVENILYVLSKELGGVQTAIWRAIFSIPGHLLFGVCMGFYFALAKYEPDYRIKNLVLALYMPWLIHGIYDFILMSNVRYYMIIFVIFIIFLWIDGLKKMKKHIDKSPFKKKNLQKIS